MCQSVCLHIHCDDVFSQARFEGKSLTEIARSLVFLVAIKCQITIAAVIETP